METSLNTDFAQIFSCCPPKSELPKNLEGGGCSPSRAPPPPARTPMHNCAVLLAV